MATRGKQPDLNDLKARLGLQPTGAPGSPGAGPPSGAQTGPPPGAVPPGATAPGPSPQPIAPSAAPAPSLGGPRLNLGPNAPSSVQAAAAAPVEPVSFDPAPVSSYEPAPQAQPVHQGPPPGARPVVGPPPGAKPPTKFSPPVDQPVLDIPVDESAGQRGAFSPAFVGLLGGVLVIGLVMGYLYSNSSQIKTLYNAQTEAAKNVRERVKPNLEEAKKVTTTLKALAKNTSKPDFETPAKLMEMKFVPEAGAVNSMIGGSNSYNITQFMAKASVLRQLIKQHNYMTNTVDKAELEDLMKNNEILQGNKQFAVIYNYKVLLDHLKNQKDDKEFKPTEGRLVAVNKWAVDDNGEVGFVNLADNKESTFSVRGIIPLNVTEILKTGGQNALQRYKQRVETLSFYAEDLDKTTAGILDGLSKLADRGEAPFIKLTASEPEPAPAKPAAELDEPAAPAAPAEPAAPEGK